MPIFNPEDWKEKIKYPHWYTEVPGVFKELVQLHAENRAEYERVKEQIYDFFEDQLRKGAVALGQTGKNLDAERKPIDTVVIHHTSMKPGLTKERLSGIDLVRLYAPQYAGKGPTYTAHKEIKDRPVYSGHFRDGVQVFWPYHWIVRTGGICERLLEDSEIGWHAGNWDVNCRSIAIVFDNDYENSEPSDVELAAVASLIKDTYPQVLKENIKGHCEINTKTTCPSKNFLSVDNKHPGWREKLVYLYSNVSRR